jgi:hypothetical protein
LDALFLTSSVLASDAPAADADLPGCCQVGLVVVGLLIWGAYRLHRREEERVAEEQAAAEQALEQARALTFEERREWEQRLIEYLYPRGALSIRQLATAVSEHDQFVLDLVHPLLSYGDLDFGIEVDSDEVWQQAFMALNAETAVMVTRQGATRIRERVNPVVNNYGDTVHAHGGSTINNRSVVVNSFNKFATKYDEETAAALIRLEELVRQSESVDAQENLDAFLEEIQRESPRRSILRSLFDGIQQAVPTVAQAGDILFKIRELMS